MSVPVVPVAGKLFLTIPETAALLGYRGRDIVYRLIARQGLPAVRLNGVYRIHAPSLRQWAGRLAQEAVGEQETAIALLGRELVGAKGRSR